MRLLMIKISPLYFTTTLFLGFLCSTLPETYAMQCLEGFTFSGKKSISRSLRCSYFYTHQKYTQPHITKRFFSSNFNNSKKFHDPENPVYILSIDGGGIRGIIPAKLLALVEEDLEATYGKPIRLASLFDIIAGTSTGGIIALGLSAPTVVNPHPEIDAGQGYPAKTLAGLYRDRGLEIFPPGGLWQNLTSLIGSKYEHNPLEGYLKAYFQDIRLRQAITRVIIPAHEMNTNVTYIFDSSDASVPTKNYAMKDVARATSAAPIYFDAAMIQNQEGGSRIFVDGGVAINNPTEVAFEKARTSGAKKFFIVSLGTGEAPKENLARLGNKGAAAWAIPIVPLMMSAASKFVDQRLVFEKNNAKDNGLEIDYIRIQPIIHPDAHAMDNVSPQNINTLEGCAYSIRSGDDGENSNKYGSLIRKLEERLAQQGTYAQDGLNHEIRFKISQIANTKGLLLEGKEIDNKKLFTIQRKIAKIDENNITFISLELLNTALDKVAIPFIVHSILKPFQIEALVLDGSNGIGEMGVEQLCNLLIDHSSNLSLTHLSLQGMKITDRVAHILGTLANKNPKIIQIKLGKNEISEEVERGLSTIKSITFKDEKKK